MALDEFLSAIPWDANPEDYLVELEGEIDEDVLNALRDFVDSYYVEKALKSCDALSQESLLEAVYDEWRDVAGQNDILSRRAYMVPPMGLQHWVLKKWIFQQQKQCKEDGKPLNLKLLNREAGFFLFLDFFQWQDVVSRKHSMAKRAKSMVHPMTCLLSLGIKNQNGRGTQLSVLKIYTCRLQFHLVVVRFQTISMSGNAFFLSSQDTRSASSSDQTRTRRSPDSWTAISYRHLKTSFGGRQKSAPPR